MICASCHADSDDLSATVVRAAGDAGVPICAACEARLSRIGVLVPCEAPDVDPNYDHGRAITEAIDAIKRAFNL